MLLRYGNELDVRQSLQLLVDHIRAGKAAQARALQVLPLLTSALVGRSDAQRQSRADSWLH